MDQPVRVAFLDGLRGWASLWVVFSHLLQMTLLNKNLFQGHEALYALLYKTPLYLVMDGTSAVYLFFIISGYSLSIGYFRRHNADSLRIMAAFRLFRLGVPMVMAALFAYLLLKMGLYFNHEAAPIVQSTWLGRFYQFEPDMIQATLGTLYYDLFAHNSETTYINVLWTMPIEVKGSFLVFSFLALARLAWRRVVAYLILLLVLRYSELVWFVIGLILCDFRVNVLADRSFCWFLPIRYHRIFEMACIAGFLAGFQFKLLKSPEWPSWLSANVFLVYVLALVALMLAIETHGSIFRLLNSRASRFMGRISFSLYLVHVPVVCSFSSWWILYSQSWTHGILARALLVTLPSLMLIFFAAYLFCLLVEEWLLIKIKGLPIW